MNRLPLFALSSAFLCCSCGEAPLAPSPLETLAVGVNVRDEAEEVLRNLTNVGYVLDQRIDARRFIALALHHEEERATVVRLVTARGVAYAVDGDDSIIRRTPRVTLVVPEVAPARLREANEIVISLHDHDYDHACLRIITIEDDDTAREVPVRTSALTPEACIESLRDVDGDGSLEAMVVYRAVELARGDTPTLELPLARDPATAGLVESRRAYPEYFRREVERRMSELETARARLDAERAYLLGVELAMLTLMREGTPTDGQAQLDRAVAGLVLTESQARSLTDTRNAIGQGMTRLPTNATHEPHGQR